MGKCNAFGLAGEERFWWEKVEKRERKETERKDGESMPWLGRRRITKSRKDEGPKSEGRRGAIARVKAVSKPQRHEDTKEMRARRYDFGACSGGSDFAQCYRCLNHLRAFVSLWLIFRGLRSGSSACRRSNGPRRRRWKRRAASDVWVVDASPVIVLAKVGVGRAPGRRQLTGNPVTAIPCREAGPTGLRAGRPGRGCSHSDAVTGLRPEGSWPRARPDDNASRHRAE